MTKQSRRRVTAADVAAMAGVSRSAVSRAFTEGAYLDAAKREVILKVAEEVGYRPNALAASLQGAGSNLVAIFVGEMPNSYDKEVATALVTGLNEAGKWPIVIGGSGVVARNAIQSVLRYPLEAMILRSGSMDADVVAACVKLGIPVISSGRIVDDPQVHSICVKNYDGMKAMTGVLLAKGRRRFVYMTGPEAFASSSERRKGCEDALTDAGCKPVAVLTGDYSVAGGYDAMARFGRSTDFDAVVCANDAMAIGALSWLRQNGYRVPVDVSITGFDDASSASWPDVELTTVRNPIGLLVDGVLALLTLSATGNAYPARIKLLDPVLVERATH